MSISLIIWISFIDNEPYFNILKFFKPVKFYFPIMIHHMNFILNLKKSQLLNKFH